MKKKMGMTKLLAIAVLFGMTLSACNDAQTSKPAEDSSPVAKEASKEPPSADPVKMDTIRVWSNDSGLKPAVELELAKFAESTGVEQGISIDYQLFGGDYPDVLKVALAAEQGPEIYKFVGTVKDPFIESGWMIPLEEFDASKPLLEKYKDLIIEEYNTHAGKTYSIPFKVITTKFIYNKTLFEKSGIAAPPVTWAEAVEDARMITEKGEGNEFGFGVHLKDAGSAGKWYFAVQFAPSVGHMGYNFKTGEYQFIDFLPCMDALVQMRKDGSMFPGAEGMDNDGLRAQFAEGRVGMMFGVSWDVPAFGSALEVKADWGAADIPVADAGNRYKEYAQIGDLLVMGPEAKKLPEKSMLVYEFMQNDDLQLDIQEKGLEFMVREDIQGAVKVPPTLTGWKEFSDTSKSYFTKTQPDGVLKLEGQSYQNVLANLLATDNPDVKAELEDLDKRYNAALDKAVAEGFDKSPFVFPDYDVSLK